MGEGKNRNLWVRIGSAAVLAPLLVWLVLLESIWPLALCVHIVSAIGVAELLGIMSAARCGLPAKQAEPSDAADWSNSRAQSLLRWFSAGWGFTISAVIFWRGDVLLLAIAGLVISISVVQLAFRSDLSQAPQRIAGAVFAVLYAPPLLTSVALLKRAPDGTAWVFVVLTVVFFTDTGAYFVGRAFGRRKLAPQVSPKKTLEGAFGGLIFGFVAAVLAKFWYLPGLSWHDAVLVSVPGSILGQVGDLVESMIKRAYGVKDSGRLIPGHGGILDRIDALLFVGPYVYFYVTHVLR